MKITFNAEIYKNESDNPNWESQCNTAQAIINQFNNGYKTMILADEVGMGKTYTALAVMAQFIKKGKKVLLIVPAGEILEKKWLGEIENFNTIYLNNDKNNKTIKFQAALAHDIEEAISFIKIKNIDLQKIRKERKQYFVYCFKKWLKNKNINKSIKISVTDVRELKERFYSIYPEPILNEFFNTNFYKDNKLNETKLNTIIEQIEEKKNYQILQKLHKSLKKYIPNVIIINMYNNKFNAGIDEGVFSLAVIDEAHNWKNGAYGASDFQEKIAPHIENKLLLTATPVQLHADELKSLIDFASGDDNNNSIRLLNNLNSSIDECAESSQEFFNKWKELTSEQLKDLNSHFNNQKEPEELIAQINNELTTFKTTILKYKKDLKNYEEKLKNIVIRNNKSKDKRYFHCGNEFSTDNLKLKNKHYLYETTGYSNTHNQLLSFIGMRAQQLIAKKNTQNSVRLLYGINSSYEAFNLHVENKKIKNSDNQYMDFFLTQIKNSKHPKITATVERAYNNLLNGKKTLIFCERIATQKKIDKELKSKIINTILKHEKKNKGSYNNETKIIKDKIQEKLKQNEQEETHINTIANKIINISDCFKAIAPNLSGTNAIDFLEKLYNHINIKEIHLVNTKSYQIWQAIVSTTSNNELVNIINGSTKNDARINRCTGFNSPLAPYILICTAIGSEGIDLHQCCDDIIIHDLPWNPAKLEQKIGRIDRNECLAEKEKGTNKIGIPFLANDYDELQYKILLSRSQMQEILFGDFLNTKFDYRGLNSDEENASDKSEVLPLPQKLIDFLTLDLSVKKN